VNVHPKLVGSIPAKTHTKKDKSNLHGFELHRLSSKGTKLLFPVMKAIINQSTIPDFATVIRRSSTTERHGKIRQSFSWLFEPGALVEFIEKMSFWGCFPGILEA